MTWETYIPERTTRRVRQGVARLSCSSAQLRFAAEDLAEAEILTKDVVVEFDRQGRRVAISAPKPGWTGPIMTLHSTGKNNANGYITMRGLLKPLGLTKDDGLLELRTVVDAGRVIAMLPAGPAPAGKPASGYGRAQPIERAKP